MDEKIVILDRDGVINKESHAYIKSPNEWHPIEGSIDGIALLTKADFTITIATNQSGLGRGLFNKSSLDDIHKKMNMAIEKAGGCIGKIFVCPHTPDDHCNCRKPMPGLLMKIAAHYKISITGIPFLGDSLNDIQAAKAAGAREILVRTGNGLTTEKLLKANGQNIETYDNLLMFAHQIIKEERI